MWRIIGQTITIFHNSRKKEDKMSISKRQEQILSLLDEHGFLTVARLSEITYTSPSSIRRDLVHLQNQSLIRRTHGGASLFREINEAVPLNSRMTKNTAEKRKIARTAATLLHDGQTIMLDGSSTAGFLVPHIAKFKDIILFTNNMFTAINAVNYGIKTHCIGGLSVNQSAVLSGADAYAAAEKIHPDLLFFSSKSIDKNGYIYDPIQEENHIREIMIKNANRTVFLCDGDKFGTKSLYRLCSLDEVDIAVFDKAMPELKTK